MNHLLELHQEISKISPIDGISFGEEIRVDFASDATEEQKTLVLSSLPDLILSVTKKARIAGLSKDCESAIYGGFISDALGSPHHYNGEPNNQINLAGLGMAGVSIDYTCTELASGIKGAKFHAATQINQVFLDGIAHKSAQMQRYRDLKALVEAATTQEEVEAVDW